MTVMTESQIEEALSIYNNTYCEERKGHVSGGNAERTAMRAVLAWAIRQDREAIDKSIVPATCPPPKVALPSEHRRFPKPDR